MKYNFNKNIDRFGTDCIKWDFLETFFQKKDLNALWVADMDFQTPPEILKPLQERLNHGVFGYTGLTDSFYNSVINWFTERYSWSIKKNWIITTPGVVPALSIVIQEVTEKDDEIIIQSPVYFPFKEAIELNDRKVIDNKLILKDKKYYINWSDLEEKAKTAKMLILCSPHNPVSRVWTEEELTKLGSICEKNDLLIFSDEIHADIIFKGHQHLPTASINLNIQNRTIAAYACSKTFNLAGLHLATIIIPSFSLRKKFKGGLEKLHLTLPNIFGVVGTEAAYQYGEEWLEELLTYLWKNYKFVDEYLKANIPQLSVIKPEGTFLLWLDCSKLNLSDNELATFFIQDAKLALTNGIMFGSGGSGFMRLNIGCPKSNLVSALESLNTAISNIERSKLELKNAPSLHKC